MQLKLDDKGNAVVSDGKPVYVHDDGKEIPFDVVGTVNTISRLNGEAKAHRERAEKAEIALKGFEGIVDPAKALEALNVVQNLDAKKLVDAGKVDEVKAEVAKAFESKILETQKAYESQLKSLQEKAETFERQLYSEKIGGNFSRSKFIADKVNESIPHDMLMATFGNSYKIEDGREVAYDSTGQKIYSRIKPGELAGFDESLEILVTAHPHKDKLLRSSNASGTGATASNARSSSGAKTMPRTAWQGMNPTQQHEFIKSGGALVD